MSRYFVYIIINISLLLLPFCAFAANVHDYTCTDFSHIDSGGSCVNVGGFAVITGSNWSAYDSNSPPAYPLSIGTWYVTYTITTGAAQQVTDLAAQTAMLPTGVGTHTDQSISIGSNNDTLYFEGASGRAWGLSNVCITDTIGACAGPPPPASTSTRPGFTEVWPLAASSTPVNNYVISDNPNQDLFNVVALFFALVFGMMFLFRRR